MELLTASHIATLVFYVFSFLLVMGAAMVIVARNPVHSVLSLIFCFFNAAGLFVLLGAEYLAMTLVIVYVGAVAVLFLFVVMMLNINFSEWREGFARYLPIGAGVGILLFILLGSAYMASGGHMPEHATGNPIPDEAIVSNTRAIGQVLYTEYLYPFQLAGIILLVAMIGAIVLTLRHRPGVRKQRIATQVARRREDCVALVSVKPGEGV